MCTAKAETTSVVPAELTPADKAGRNPGGEILRGSRGARIQSCYALGFYIFLVSSLPKKATTATTKTITEIWVYQVLE